MSLIRQGDIVPLVISIECPDRTFYVVARITNQSGTLLSTRTLNDQGDGTFDDFTYTFPATSEVLKVRYFVYDDVGLTTLSTDICPNPVAETFEKLLVDGSQDIEDKLDQLINTLNSTSNFTGSILSSTPLVASLLSEQDLVANILASTQLIADLADTESLDIGLDEIQLLQGELNEC